ncbi:MAG: 1-acyl-sn-glycerol-3-phosphate acyltransferase [Nocardioidaceae bacterium]|nr:1-acyl-sn-glycerol-3-phosphate acyltransferase [Nocardioidaceae bacterium]
MSAQPSRELPERRLRILRAPGGRYVRRKWRIREHGLNHVPTSGAAIFASNHIGWLDGPLLISTAPRPLHALVKKEMFSSRSGLLLRATGQISIERHVIDSGAIRTAVDALSADQALVIFPEGRRTDGEFTDIKPGVGYLALVSGAPVVPVAIFGTRLAGEPYESRPAKKQQIDIVYGKPFWFAPLDAPRTAADVLEATTQIHDRLRSHIKIAKELTNLTLPGPAQDGDDDE